MGKRGLTILELVIVIIIVGVLASLSLPKYQIMVEKACSVEAISILSTVKRAQERYCAWNGGDWDIGSSDGCPTEILSNLDIELKETQYFGAPVNTPASQINAFVAAMVRKGGLYTMYMDMSGKVYCSHPRTAPSSTYCQDMGYKVIIENPD